MVPLALAGCMQGGDAAYNAASSYAVKTVEPEDIYLSESYPASIQGRRDIGIYPQVSGTISNVFVKEGQRVRKGQSLFIIDQVPFKAALQMAQANVEAAEARVATAQLVYDSRVKLCEKNVISEFDMLTGRNDLLTAKAALTQAKAQLVTAENNMVYTQVLSPCDGVVGTLPYREGSLVSPQIQVPLTTVSDNSTMYVYFSLSETQFLGLTESHSSMSEVIGSIPELKLELSNKTVYPFEGKTETISGVVDRNTGSVSVRAVFPNEGGILHSGMSGKVILTRPHENAIIIPCKATFEIQDKIFAFKVVDGKAVAAQLKVMLTDDGRNYVVTSGLESGDTIVLEGADMIREGQEISGRNE